MAKNSKMLRGAGWTSDERVIVVRQPEAPVRVLVRQPEWSSPQHSAIKNYEWSFLEGDVTEGGTFASSVMTKRLPSVGEL